MSLPRSGVKEAFLYYRELEPKYRDLYLLLGVAMVFPLAGSTREPAHLGWMDQSVEEITKHHFEQETCL